MKRGMISVLVLSILVLICGRGSLAEIYPHQATASPQNARFEIIQSPRTGMCTLRLDRFSRRGLGIAADREWRLLLETDACSWFACHPRPPDVELMARAGFTRAHLGLGPVPKGRRKS